MQWLADKFLLIYRGLASPVLHAFFGPGYGCRFEPSCGRYAREAVRLHGPVRGAGLALRRLCRCHPFSRTGFDPVPRYGIDSTQRAGGQDPSSFGKVSAHGP